MAVNILVGQTLGQYELRELLGVGGMGAVYKGYQANLKRYVAVKVLAAHLINQAGALERFNREAQTSAALEHPNIIPIHDYGTQRGVSYLVLKLLTGGSLAERLEQGEGKLPSLGEIAVLLKSLGSALDYAHSQGVIHRDIKPSNVMFDNHGTPYLVDFGIAKLVEGITGGLTASGVVVGTWGYMAPEQWRAEELSGAVDQYALAVMTYALISGRMPFDAPTPAGIMHKHLNEMPTPPHSLRPNVPQAVTLILERALAKDARQRFVTCTTFAQTFDGAIRGSTGPTTQFFSAPIQRRLAHIPATGNQSSRVFAEPATTTLPFYKSRAAWAMIALILMMAAVIVAFASGILSSAGGEKSNPAATQAVVVSTMTLTSPALTTAMSIETLRTSATLEPTDTPPLVTPTVLLSPTLSETDIAGTVAVEMALVLVEITRTADADSTQTATQWTDTPTPYLRGTAVTYLTVTRFAADTATADAWTSSATSSNTSTSTATSTGTLTFTPTCTPTRMLTLTPTNTLTWTPAPTVTPTVTWTLTPTSTPTLDPLQAALERAQNFSGSNSDWIPFNQEFDGVEMVLVPVGCFTMWSGENDPVVCIDEPFWIDRYEVSNKQFTQLGGNAEYLSRSSGENQPREQISWPEALNFCAQRGTTLPTETEWEYAARGPDNLMYPWGNTFDCGLGNFDDEIRLSSDIVRGGEVGCDGFDETAPVGSFPGGVSWVGAFDMSGNVWEWVADEESEVGSTPVPSTNEYHTVRGGSWHDYAGLTRHDVTSYGWDRTNRYLSVGFRCARSAGD